MYATAGPRKKIDYSRPEGEDGDDNFNAYDAARLDHGTILYVEEGDIKNKKLEDFNWH